MKTLYISLILSIIISLNAQAQDIKAKLAGHQATNGFTVVDDDDNVLFHVTGEGDVGVNTGTPSGLFHIFGGQTNSSIGKPIKITAQAGTDIGGYVLLEGGKGGSLYAGDGARIIVGGGNLTESNAGGGDIHILSGDGPDYGGDINIETSSHFQFPVNNLPLAPQSQLKVGDINIHTGGSNLQGGNIRIYTGEDNGGGGDIEISTGNSEGDGNKITLRTGVSGGNGSDIILEAGSGGTGGEDIVLTPNSNGGFVLVNGSGTYTGNWTQASDKRFKKDVNPLENSLDKITQLNAVEYEWKKEEYPDKNFQDGKQIGLIAQDVEKIIPRLVSTDSEGYKSIDYSKINVLLIEAIKEQQKSIEDLKKEVGELRSKLMDEVSLITSDNE